MISVSLSNIKHSRNHSSSNESFLNLKHANKSFLPGCHDELPSITRRSCDSRTRRDSFSWQYTWRSDSSVNSQVSQKTLYYKGKMFSLPEPEQTRDEISTRTSSQTSPLFDTVFLAASSFSAFSFITFVFAIAQRFIS